MLNNDKENIKKIYLEEHEKKHGIDLKEIVIDINKTNSLSSSEDDLYRKELLWSSKLDHLMNDFMKNCNDLSIRHGKKSKKQKKLYVLFSVPSILISVILTGTSNYIQDYHEITTIAIILMGLSSGLNTFFNFAKKTEQHNQYENLYLELYNDIRNEMNKPKANRLACDVYIDRTKNKINFLRKSAPDL